MPTMRECILETGTYMRKVLAGGDEVFKRIAERRFAEIVMCGSGSSCHAAIMAQHVMQSMLDIPIAAIYPFQADGRSYANPSRTLFVGISQSGTSVSTLRAMEEAREAGCATVSVSTTFDEGTIINSAADYILTVPCGVEADLQPKTEGTVCMALGLIMLAKHCAASSCSRRSPESVTAALKALVDNVGGIVAAAEAWVSAHGEMVAASEDIKIVGTRAAYGAVLEGGLKFLETLRVSAAGYEVEEFIHGPYNSINEKTLMLLVGERGSMVDRLADAIREWTPNIVVASEKALTDLDFEIPNAGRPWLIGFEAILWLYVICDRVSQMKGIDTSITKDPTFHSKLGSKALR